MGIWSGQVAKSICRKKRTRTFWNIFWGVVLLVVVIAMSSCIYQILCDYVTYESEQTYINIDGNSIITDAGSFTISESSTQTVFIDKINKTVKKGDTVSIEISLVTDELIRITHNEVVVYEQQLVSIWATAIAMVLLVFPMIGFSIFMLVITNIKNPSKRIDKIQSQYLLRFYK